jgi:hypothetical protein
MIEVLYVVHERVQHILKQNKAENEIAEFFSILKNIQRTINVFQHCLINCFQFRVRQIFQIMIFETNLDKIVDGT